MKRAPMVLCLGLLLIFASISVAEMTPEKVAFYAELDAAISAYNDGVNLSPTQHALLKRAGYFNDRRGELDHFGGPDDFGYSFIDSDELDGPEYNWIDISETGTAINNWDDDITLGPFDIGFDFPFYGETYTQVYLCSNGWMSFSDGGGIAYDWDEEAGFPLVDTPNNAIYWNWRDLFPIPGNDFAYYGDDGNGNAVFQFEFYADDDVQAEVILSPDGTILMQYGPNHTVDIGWQGTRVGLENADGTVGILASDAEIPANYPRPELAILWEMLDMGIIAGTITDNDTGNPIAEAEINIYQDDELFRTVYSDELGEYSTMIEIGDYDVMSVAMGYEASDMVPVTVVLDETEIVDFALVQGAIPEISVNTDNLTITVPWMGMDSDVLTVSNLGGLDLDFFVDVELIEAEMFANGDLRERVRRNFENTMPIHNVNNVINGNSREFPYATPTQEKFSELDDPYFLLVQDSNPWGYTSNQEVLELLEIPYDLINSTTLADIDLDDYTVIMTAGVQNTDFHINLANSFDRIQDFVRSGGYFQFCGSLGSNWTLWDGTTVVGNYNDINVVVEPDHPMLVDLPNQLEGNSANHGTISNYPEDAIVLIETNTNEPTLIEYELGRGHVIVTTQTWEYYWNNGEGDNHTGEVLRRAVAYCAEYAGGGWLSVEPDEGTIAPDGTMDVTVTGDASVGELFPGTYEGMLHFASDFPNVETYTVWVNLVVEDPGSIGGTVTNTETNNPIPNAEIRHWLNEVEYESYFCDELGNYEFPVGEGTHTLTAIAQDHYESDAVQVEVAIGQVTNQDFALDPHIPPEIEIDLENMVFNCAWMSTDSDVLTITNNGGLDLNWKVSVEYVEEELAVANVEDILARRLAGMPVLDPNPNFNLQDATPGVVIDPDFTPTFELDEGPYLVMGIVNFENSLIAALNNLEIEYTFIQSDNYATVDLTEYGTLICGHDGGNPTTQDAEAVCEFMANGGTLMYFGGTTIMSNAFVNNGVVDVLDTGWRTSSQPHINIVDENSSLAEDVPDGYTMTNNSASYNYIRYSPNEDADVAIQNGDGANILFAQEYGDGLFIPFANSPSSNYWSNEDDNAVLTQIMSNMINYASGWLVFDERNGSIVPGRDQEIIVTADASQGELNPGVYEASITFESDHHLTEPVTIWATMTVRDPGSISGHVSDEATGDALAGAEIRVWSPDGLEFVSYYCDEEGNYLFPIGAGEYTVTAINTDYYESEPAIVPVTEGLVTQQDFTLDHHIPPLISVDPENFMFEVPWFGHTSSILNISNFGGLDLNYSIDVEYIEEEEMAAHNQLVERIRDFRRNLVHPPIATVITEDAASSHDIVNSGPSAARYSELDDPYFLIFQDSNPWGNMTHTAVLDAAEIPYDVVGSAMMADHDFGDYTVIMFPSVQGQNFYNTFQNNSDRFEEWVNDGGWLDFHGCTYGEIWTLWDGTTYVSGSDRINRVVEPDHPIAMDIPEEFTGSSANHGYMNNVPDEALVIITDTAGRPVVIETPYGRGNMVVSTETYEFGAGQNPPQGAGYVMANAILYCAENATGGGWLALEPNRGVIAPDDDMDLDVLVDAAPGELDPGSYEAMITVEAEHPETEPVTIFATLIVGLPGTIEGTVTDAETGSALAGVEVIIWNELGEYFRSTFTDDLGNYSIYIGGGTWDVSAQVAEYYESDIVPVVAVVGEITVQNFELFHHIPPTIDIDEEFITFVSPPMGIDEETMVISNNGGLPLNYDISFEYFDDAEIAQRLIRTGSIYPQRRNAELDADLSWIDAIDPNPDFNLQEASSIDVANPNFAPTYELDEGPYLVMGIVDFDNSLLAALDNLEIEYTFIASDNYSTVDLSEYGTLICGHDGGNPQTQDAEAVCEFMANGGTLLYFGGTSIMSNAFMNNGVVNVMDTGWRTSNAPHINIIDENSNLAEDVPDGYTMTNNSASYNYIRYSPNEDADVAIQNGNGNIILFAQEYGEGLFIPFANSPASNYWANDNDNAVLTQIMNNMINYAGSGWLSADPQDGTVEVGDDIAITLTANAEDAELPEGIYEGLIQIESDHRDTPPEVVWAEYVVGAGGIFHPVAPTGDAYPLVIDEVILNGEPIGPNAGIGIFDGDLCVGAMTTTDVWPRSMVAWGQGDPEMGLQGFVSGNPMTFKVWREDLEGPIDGMATIIEGDGNFGTLPYTRISTLVAAEIPTLNLRLQENYFELISFSVVPEDINAATIFNTIPDFAIAYESSGDIYLPPDLNFIGDIDFAQGYRVFCYENSSLTVQGEILDPNTQYTVEGGIWNWIGYPFYHQVPVEVALANMADNINIVLADDGRLWIPGIINNMGNMLPGEGYMIFPETNMQFTYVDNAVANIGGTEEQVVMPMIEGKPASTGMPYAVVVNFSEEAMAMEPATIEIYDGSILVGKEGVLEDSPTPVIAWQGNSDYNVSGFTPGNNMSIVVRAADGTKLPLVSDGNKPAFGEDAYANISMKVVEMPTEFAVEQGYPNPFNPSVTVPFAIPAKGDVAFTVFNVLGQEVYHSSQSFDTGFHRFVFNASNSGNELVSGMYFLKVDYQGKAKTQKLMLLK